MPVPTRRIALIACAAAAAGGLFWYLRAPPGQAEAEALYARPLPKPEAGLKVFHLGHSLVSRDMPFMVEQLAGAEHVHHSQLGWGTSLREHWEPDLPVNGFEQENAHPRFRAAKEAIGSGAYDAVVLTEMVEIKDAIKYHDSADYLARWAGLAAQANPKTRIYLYESWHHTDDKAGWLNRIDSDLDKYWQARVLNPALAQSGAPIHLIPAGQVMAAFVRQIEAGQVAGMTSVADLFAPEDTIHYNDLGAYLVALTHFAVLYHRSPVGLPYALKRADGSDAVAPTAEVAAIMQQAVWDVVRRFAETGVAV